MKHERNRRAVIVGGFVTGNHLLEPVADALCERFGFEDAEIFGFKDCIGDTSELERALRGQTGVGHSAGALALSECTGMAAVAAFNCPEPLDLYRGSLNYMNKTSRLWAAAIMGPDRRGAARVLATNTMHTMMFPAIYMSHMKSVSTFSTAAQLSRMEDAGVRTVRVDTDRDEFFGPYELQEWDGKRAVVAGCHDQVLIDPTGVMGRLPADIFAD